MRGRIRVCAILVAVTATVATNGAAATPQQAHYTDAVGDANGLWDYALAPVIGNRGADARPASIDGADVVNAWWETRHRVERHLDDEGNVTSLQHVPTALEFHVQTAAPSSPTFGPTLAYDFYGTMGPCYVGVSFAVRGPYSRHNDPENGARLYRGGSGCPGGTIGVDTTFLRFDGNVTVATFPLGSLRVGGISLVEPGATIEAAAGDYGGEVYVVRADDSDVSYAYKTIDAYDPQGHAYVVGSDVPPDMDCTVSPTPEACR